MGRKELDRSLYPHLQEANVYLNPYQHNSVFQAELYGIIELLFDEETIISVAAVSAGDTPCIAALTDQRLLIVAATGWRKKNLQSIDIPLETIASFTVGRNTVEVHHSGGVFETFKSDDIERLTADARQLLHQLRHQPAQPTTNGNLAEELERIADLHGRGVLSDAEFATAKQRLLS